MVAVLTALVVFEIGSRLRSPEIGLVAALLTTLHPYVVWHDVHLNRELLDGLVLAVLVLCALAAYERRSLPLAAATGAVAGVAILGNARLILLPVALALYLAWRTRFSHAVTAAALVVGMAAIVVVPWVARNRVQVGCYAITTDARALWKANNENTRAVLDRGGWIDDVPELPGAPPWPELAADLTLAGKPTIIDECAQMRLYRGEVVDFWREQPGEKARLAAAGDRDALEPRAARVGRERERNGAPRSQDDRTCVHGRSLRAGRRRRLRRPALLRRPRRAHACLQHPRRDGLRRNRAVSDALGLPPRAPRRFRAGVSLGAHSAAASPALRRRRIESARVELLHPLDAALRRELRERPRAPRCAHLGRAAKVTGQLDDRIGERIGIR